MERKDHEILIDTNGHLDYQSSLTDAEFLEVVSFVSKQWPLDESQQEKEPFFPFSLPEGDEVVFYPGSFSPWHKGHGACVRNAPADKPLVIMPDHNPWKEVKKEGLWESVSLIWKDLHQMKKEKPHRSLSLYLGFLGLNKRNPTAKWMSYYREVWPHKKIWLLMGEDTFLSLHEWYEAEKLLNLLDGIYVCPRGESKELVKDQREKIEQMAQTPITIEELEAHRYEHFSSTFIRESK